MYFWGAQMEAGSFPTSTSLHQEAQTRVADLVKITEFTDFYNQNEGTFFIDSALLEVLHIRICWIYNKLQQMVDHLIISIFMSDADFRYTTQYMGWNW